MLQRLLYLKINWKVTGILVLFLVIFSLISLVNHYNFRTHGWDLGLFNKAMYEYSHFTMCKGDLLHPLQYEYMVGDHFTLIQMVLSPLMYLFGSYTLLIIQIVAILFGGIGIYRIADYFQVNERAKRFILIHFYAIWAIQSALAYDYHDNVLGAMLMPWLMYYLLHKRLIKVFVLFVLILMCKEVMAMWMFFVCFGTLFTFKWDKRERWILIGMGIFSMAYFLAIVNVFMPAINGVQEYYHNQYTYFGDGMTDVIINLIKSPSKIFEGLFLNHNNYEYGDGIKLEFWYVFLLSGGILMVFKPQLIIFCAPTFLIKFFNDDFQKWGLNFHYNIELVPVLSLAMICAYRRLHKKWKSPVVFGVMALTILLTHIKMFHRTSKWYTREKSNIYRGDHYSPKYNVSNIYAAIDLIPDEASVCAQSNIVPHVSMRDTISQHPYIKGAEYIILDKALGIWPQSKEEYLSSVDSLCRVGTYDCIYDKGTTLLFKRK